MRLLRVACPGAVAARRCREVIVSQFTADVLADFLHRFAGHLHGIGSHIRDQADRSAARIYAFIERLGHPHGPLRRHAELAGSGLLHGGGRERRGRPALGPGGGDSCYGQHPQAVGRRALPHGRQQQAAGLVRCLGIAQRELLQLLAIQLRQGRLEFLSVLGQMRGNGPVLARLERLDFLFPLHDQPQGGALHAARREAARENPRQQRRKGESDQPVHAAPGLLGLDQRHGDVARIFDRLADRAACDLVEGHPVNLLVFQRSFIGQQLQQVPGYGLALAVGIGCQIQRRHPGQCAADPGHRCFRTFHRLELHCEPLPGVDRQAAALEISDVSVAGQHPVVLAEIALQGSRLGGRFDHDQAARGPFAGGSRHEQKTCMGRFVVEVIIWLLRLYYPNSTEIERAS